jgi:hypothetical protein
LLVFSRLRYIVKRAGRLTKIISSSADATEKGTNPTRARTLQEYTSNPRDYAHRDQQGSHISLRQEANFVLLSKISISPRSYSCATTTSIRHPRKISAEAFRRAPLARKRERERERERGREGGRERERERDVFRRGRRG